MHKTKYFNSENFCNINRFYLKKSLHYFITIFGVFPTLPLEYILFVVHYSDCNITFIFIYNLTTLCISVCTSGLSLYTSLNAHIDRNDIYISCTYITQSHPLYRGIYFSCLYIWLWSFQTLFGRWAGIKFHTYFRYPFCSLYFLFAFHNISFSPFGIVGRPHCKTLSRHNGRAILDDIKRGECLSAHVYLSIWVIILGMLQGRHSDAT